MKDRWKILIASIIITLILSFIFLVLAFSFKRVGLRQYGILEYQFFKTVSEQQSVRSSGNYLIGLDYIFIPYPKGIQKHKFTVTTLSKDKSMVSMEGLFLGQLIESEIMNMHFNYGPQEYFKLVGKSVEQAFRQSLQQFLLKEFISQRSSVNSFISSNVCLNVQSQYSFINCKYVSTGKLLVNASPLVLKPQTSVQEYLKKLLQQTIQAQKVMNIYGNGGFNLIQNIEEQNAKLFLNTSQLLVATMSNFTTTGSEFFAAGSYILQNPLMPLLNNQIDAVSLTDK